MRQPPRRVLQWTLLSAGNNGNEDWGHKTRKGGCLRVALLGPDEWLLCKLRMTR